MKHRQPLASHPTRAVAGQALQRHENSLSDEQHRWQVLFEFRPHAVKRLYFTSSSLGRVWWRVEKTRARRGQRVDRSPPAWTMPDLSVPHGRDTSDGPLLARLGTPIPSIPEAAIFGRLHLFTCLESLRRPTAFRSPQQQEGGGVQNPGRYTFGVGANVFRVSRPVGSFLSWPEHPPTGSLFSSAIFLAISHHPVIYWRWFDLLRSPRRRMERSTGRPYEDTSVEGEHARWACFGIARRAFFVPSPSRLDCHSSIIDVPHSGQVPEMLPVRL